MSKFSGRFKDGFLFLTRITFDSCNMVNLTSEPIYHANQPSKSNRAPKLATSFSLITYRTAPLPVYHLPLPSSPSLLLRLLSSEIWRPRSFFTNPYTFIHYKLKSLFSKVARFILHIVHILSQSFRGTETIGHVQIGRVTTKASEVIALLDASTHL